MSQSSLQSQSSKEFEKFASPDFLDTLVGEERAAVLNFLNTIILRFREDPSSLGPEIFSTRWFQDKDLLTDVLWDTFLAKPEYALQLLFALCRNQIPVETPNTRVVLREPSHRLLLTEKELAELANFHTFDAFCKNVKKIRALIEAQSQALFHGRNEKAAVEDLDRSLHEDLRKIIDTYVQLGDSVIAMTAHRMNALTSTLLADRLGSENTQQILLADAQKKNFSYEQLFLMMIDLLVTDPTTKGTFLRKFFPNEKNPDKTKAYLNGAAREIISEDLKQKVNEFFRKISQTQDTLDGRTLADEFYLFFNLLPILGNPVSTLAVMGKGHAQVVLVTDAMKSIEEEDKETFPYAADRALAVGGFLIWYEGAGEQARNLYYGEELLLNPEYYEVIKLEGLVHDARWQIFRKIADQPEDMLKVVDAEEVREERKRENFVQLNPIADRELSDFDKFMLARPTRQQIEGASGLPFDFPSKRMMFGEIRRTYGIRFQVLRKRYEAMGLSKVGDPKTSTERYPSDFVATILKGIDPKEMKTPHPEEGWEGI